MNDASALASATTPLLPSQTCVDALVETAGNQRLAAERLGVSVSTLIASIAADPSAGQSLNAQLRTMTTLMAFDTLRVAKVIADNMMSDMDPADFAKFFNQLIAALGNLTDDHTSTQNVNIVEVVLKMLPPEARNALLSLVSTPDQLEASYPPNSSSTGGPDESVEGEAA